MNVAAKPQVSQSSVAQLLQGVEQSREGFALCDASGCFIYMNAEHLRMFGYDSLGEVLGRPWTILYREAEQAEIASTVFPQIAQMGCWNGHLMALRRDGTLFHEDLTLSMLPDGGIVCNCRDRTALVELNRQLSRSERLFREFSENLPEGVIIRGTDGVCSYINRLGTHLHGGVLREAIGRRLEDVLPEALRTVFCSRDAEAIANRAPVRFECNCCLAEGTVALEFMVFPLIDAAGELHSLGTIWTDVSIRRRHQQEIAATVERQRELLQMRSEFISLVSHEFRTPLSAIQISHFLVRKFLGEAERIKVERYLTLQSEAIDNLRDLVSQVLRLNRVESAVGAFKGESAQPADILGKLIDHCNETAGAQRVQSRFGLPAGFVMVLDTSLFRAAAENLLTNALKYSPPDSPVIVEVGCRDRELVLSVVDHGRGIPAADQSRLFETFFRASNVGSVPGTGLGLAIVRRAVDLHGGRVTFESTENQGTAFHLHFPLAAPTPAQSGADTIPFDQS